MGGSLLLVVLAPNATTFMKKYFLPLIVFLVTVNIVSGQEIQTLFRNPRPSGGYGAISNKFTTIKGQYANMAEVYGGWFIKRRFLLGVGAAATTNNIEVPVEFRTEPMNRLSWQYSQMGLVTEYVFASNKAIHFNITLFSGAGLTVQYMRYDWDDWDTSDINRDMEHDANFFYVMEPGAQVELNLFKWMRLSPGVSYRKTFGSEGLGLNDDDLSDWSYNVTLKFGKF